MPIIVRNNNEPGSEYSWCIGEAPLAEVANVEQMMPRDYISECGFDITPKCREYLLPLIQGEAYPPYKNGIPVVAKLKKVKVEKRLDSAFRV